MFCVARKESDLAMIESFGYNKINMAELDIGLEKYDFIFNTAPAMVLDKKRLDKIRKECVIIDLASKPGGVDFDVAKEKGIKAILALRATWESGATFSSKIHKRYYSTYSLIFLRLHLHCLLRLLKQYHLGRLFL